MIKNLQYLFYHNKKPLLISKVKNKVQIKNLQAKAQLLLIINKI